MGVDPESSWVQIFPDATPTTERSFIRGLLAS